MSPGRRSAGRRVALAIALGLLWACTSVRSKVHHALEGLPGAKGPSVCVLFFDGLSQQAFQKLASDGTIPTLQREVLQRALVVDTAVTGVPSETYPNVASMITGLLPGHHGIPANVWLDRRLHRRESHTNIFRHFSASEFLIPEAKTLYERLPGDTVAITTPLARGAGIYRRNIVSVIASYARNDWPFLDRKTLDDIGDAYAGGARLGKVPTLVWGHLLGPDEVAHFYGPDSTEWRNEFASIDRAFARLVRRLTRMRVYDRILWVLIGDHGNHPYTTYVDSAELVHRALYSHPTTSDCSKGNCYLVTRRPDKHFDVGDAEIAVGAYRGVMVWLPSDRPPADLPAALRTRKKPRKQAHTGLAAAPRSDFAAALAHMKEVQLAVTRGPDPGSVLIYGPAGRSAVTSEEGPEHEVLYAYHVLEGEDPLGYEALPGLRARAGQGLPAEEWLELTAESEYPDLVVQLSEFFDSPRAPDVFLSPREGYGFRDGKAAGHGSFSRLETVVPLVFAGPGVTPGHRRVARVVDLTPTLLRYLGVPFDASAMDGDDLGIATVPPVLPSAPPTPDE